jgi:hypothetical protein
MGLRTEISNLISAHGLLLILPALATPSGVAFAVRSPASKGLPRGAVGGMVRERTRSASIRDEVRVGSTVGGYSVGVFWTSSLSHATDLEELCDE